MATVQCRLERQPGPCPDGALTRLPDMNQSMTQALAALAALAGFDSHTRLYALTIGDGGPEVPGSGLLVEAFVADDAVQGLGVRDQL